MLDSLKQHKIEFLNKLFIIVSGISLIFLLIFTFTIFNNSSHVFNNFILNTFDKIPVFGQILYLYIKSLNIIDISYLYENIIEKAVLIELIYYAIVIIFFQIISLLAFLKFSKDHSKTFWFIVSTSTIIALIIVNPRPLIILENMFNVSFYKYLRLFNLLLLIQLGSLGYIYFLDKETIILSFELKSKIFKITSTILISLLLGFSTILIVANSQVYRVKEVLEVDYTISFESSANDIININVPDKLQDLTSKVGVHIPGSISGGRILSALDLDSVNIGSILSSYILDLFDDIIYTFVKTPIITSIMNAALAIFIYVFNRNKFSFPFDSRLKDFIQVLLLIILLFNLNNNGIILNILATVLLIVSLNDLGNSILINKKV